jgi:isovaleryl-CoA dehydrogenase
MPYPLKLQCSFYTYSKMASISPRILSRSIRQLCTQQPRLLSLNARRYASTKHPKGFVPPTQADLQELRESVQEFARM